MNSRPFSVPADDFPEPMLLVSPDGEVLAINRAAREDFGAGYPATHLCDLVADAGEKVMAFVRLCSSTREAVPGALSFRTPAGILDCRCAVTGPPTAWCICAAGPRTRRTRRSRS